ncbi:MAG: hypothetical protein JWN18_108 [Parcubacteria group bacterium]|nr:hypothetical protein [Parcubacteria group bacterium]
MIVRLMEAQTVCFELVTQFSVVWKRLSDESPKLSGVIELAQVAELVSDHVVGEVRRQERDLVVKVEITLP